jgi:hypothetical protein
MELFVDGSEDGLPDAGQLDELGLGEGSVVFMLLRAGWCWTTCGSGITLSGNRAGSHSRPLQPQLAAGYRRLADDRGPPLLGGVHCWLAESHRCSNLHSTTHGGGAAMSLPVLCRAGPQL